MVFVRGRKTNKVTLRTGGETKGVGWYGVFSSNFRVKETFEVLGLCK